MFKTRQDEVKTPFVYSTGEKVYEMIGSSEDSGGSIRHSLSYVVIPAFSTSRRHYHLESEETFYFIKGRGKMVVDDGEFAVEPGDTVLIMPSERHQVINKNLEELEFIVVCSPAWNNDDTVFLD